MSAARDNTPTIREIAGRHGFEEGAAQAMASALLAGNGTMAQFNHPELGGMGQWSRGGMLMIGDMFNDRLKARVGALAQDLADAVGGGSLGKRATGGDGQSFASPERWWPEDLGAPSSSGGQNDSLYAIFPASRRLAVKKGGRVTVHDTGEHRISGVSQQQGPGESLRFATSSGTISVADLTEV